MKYTTAERHKIYKKAYRRISPNEPYACDAIAYAIKSHYSAICEIDFPEVFLFKEKEGMFWLSEQFELWHSGLPLKERKAVSDKRKWVLLFCIEMTRP